jgi:hypothetical protein
MNGKSNKISQLITINGTAATSAVGMSLTGTIIKSAGGVSTAPTFLRIPRGMKMKIWEKVITSTQNNESVLTQYTHNGVSTAPTGWITIDKISTAQNTSTAATPSVTIVNKRRPIILEGLTGKEAVQFVTTATAASATSITYEIEITNE